MLKALLLLGNTAEAVRLHFCDPKEKINYILKVSSSYDLPLSKAVAEAMMNGACGLLPGALPGNFSDCAELFNLGSTFASDKVAETKIKVLSCKPEPLFVPSSTDVCLTRMAHDEYHNYLDNIYFYLAAYALIASAATLIYFIYRCFDGSKFSICGGKPEAEPVRPIRKHK
jgi:hypothetical protein